MKEWLNRNLKKPILDQLKQGYSVEKISLSVASGLVIACVPILGTATSLCFLAAYFFRLNHIVIQAVNYLAYPLQLLLIIPYLSYGQKLFGDTYISLNLKQMFIEFADKPIWFFQTYGLVALKGGLLWLMTLPFAIFLAYISVKPFIFGLYKGVQKARS